MHIKITISTQTLSLLEGDNMLKTYSVSTSKNGPGQEWASFKTPLGKHEIADKIGDGAAVGAVFKERIPSGEIAEIVSGDTAPVVTMIMTLRGLEEGFNPGEDVDSYKRRIYIHGTVHEDLIGHPVSNGCIRMKNSDIIELFDMVEEGMAVKVIANK